MERALTQEERIRRATEIYLRRKNGRIVENERRTNKEKNKDAKIEIKGLKLFKRVILQIVICSLLYCIFYLIYDTNYSFSEVTLSKTEEILNYNINVESLYKYINDKIMSIFVNKDEQTMQETNVEDSSEGIEDNELETNNEESNNEEETQQNNNDENSEETAENKYNLILPVNGGYISSEFGERESTSEIVSTNHKGIDIAVSTRD